MKKNKNEGQPDRGTQSRRVHFECYHPTAKSVCLAGTFNDWRPEVTPMIALDQDRWAKDLALPPGIYEYCLVVDGQWKPDPQAPEAVLNPFGGVNSIRKVGNGGRPSQAAQTAARNSGRPSRQQLICPSKA